MAIQEFETEEEMNESFGEMMERMQDEAREREEEDRAAAVENVLQIEWHFHIDCPKCGEELDLAENGYDDDQVYSEPIFNNKWDDLKGDKVICDECEYEFEIHNIEPW
ncbi:MAG TPA: hypothetical protein DHV36_17330 [Desulfobacteraceae bacterium]|nr:hypothetical protein [Desulfobacteraceae bacterium]